MYPDWMYHIDFVTSFDEFLESKEPPDLSFSEEYLREVEELLDLWNHKRQIVICDV